MNDGSTSRPSSAMAAGSSAANPASIVAVTAAMRSASSSGRAQWATRASAGSRRSSPSTSDHVSASLVLAPQPTTTGSIPASRSAGMTEPRLGSRRTPPAALPSC